MPGHGCRLGHVAAGVDHVHADDDLAFALGGELHIEGGSKAAVAHLHDTCVGVGGARSGVFGLATVALLGRGHFGQLLQCRLDALLSLLGGTQLGRLRLTLGKAGGCLGLCLDRLHPLARLAQVFVQAGLAAKRGRTGVGAHAHAVLRHPLQADRTHGGQCGHVVSEQFVHQHFVAGTKVVERVVVHRHAPANPPVWPMTRSSLPVLPLR